MEGRARAPDVRNPLRKEPSHPQPGVLAWLKGRAVSGVVAKITEGIRKGRESNKRERSKQGE